LTLPSSSINPYLNFSENVALDHVISNTLHCMAFVIILGLHQCKLLLDGGFILKSMGRVKFNLILLGCTSGSVLILLVFFINSSFLPFVEHVSFTDSDSHLLFNTYQEVSM
jgi:hypothetical protein